MRIQASRLFLCGAFLLAFSVPVWSLTINPPGIKFHTGSWKDVLAEAKRQNKPIFLDMYTSWCPPCKRMAKEAFPDPNVGNRYNVHFINYQLDAEKGEGVLIARKYLVSSYPTSLFITPDGNLVHRAVGYGGINAMITQVDHVLALPGLKATVAKGDKAFADGKRDPNFLKKYLDTRQSLNRPVNDVLDAYIDALPESERFTPETVIIVASAIQSSNTRAFAFLLKNGPSTRAADGAEQRLSKPVSDAIYRTLINDFKEAVTTTNEALLETVIANSERTAALVNPSVIRQQALREEEANNYRLMYYKLTRNFASYRAIADPMARNQLMSQSADSLRQQDSVAARQLNSPNVFHPDSVSNALHTTVMHMPMKDRLISWKVARMLHEIADTYRAMSTNAADGEEALVWSKQAVTLYRTHEYLNTYALLLKKTGRQRDAVTVQKEAIQEADKAGWTTSEYRNQLAEMDQK